MNTALFSLSETSNLLSSSNEESTTLLKGAALLYPEIVLHTSENSVNNIVEEVATGLGKKTRKQVQKLFIPITQIEPKWAAERDDFDITLDLQDLVENDVNIDLEFAISLARDFRNSAHSNDSDFSNHLLIALVTSLNQNIPYYDEAKNLQKYIGHLQSLQPGVTANTELEITLPPVEVLSWEDVFELRVSKYIFGFREFIHRSKGVPSKEISEQISQGLWDVVGKSKPSKSGGIFKRVLGQIPMPFSLPNPFSIFFDLKSGIEERRLYNNYGWLFFIQEVRQRDMNGLKQ